MIFFIGFSFEFEEVTNFSLDQFVKVDATSFHEFCLPLLGHLLLFLDNRRIIIIGIMAFVLITIENSDGAFSELIKIIMSNFIADHVKHTPDI